MKIPIHPTDRPVSVILTEVAGALPPESVSLRELLERIGEQGLLVACILISAPFLFPIPLPLASTVLGIPILLIGIGVALNRLPYLPAWLVDRRLPSPKLADALGRAAKLFAWAERFTCARLQIFSSGVVISAVNGFLLSVAALVLMLPAPPLIPFTNAIPAAAIMTLAFGMLQRDGILILAGYLFLAIGLVYWGVIVVGIVMASDGLLKFFNGG